MAINGKLPRFLSKMNFALADYDTSFNCDWQAIAIKYVQLSFQVRNLNYWIQATHETSTVPSVSGFFRKNGECYLAAFRRVTFATSRSAPIHI